MKYEIRKEEKVIGTTELEGGDPPMGFVFGVLHPTAFYSQDSNNYEYSVYTCDTNKEIASESVTIEDNSEEMGEQCIEITVLVKSSEEYRKFFKHHIEKYEN